MEKKQKKTLIFVFPYSVTSWDAERYGFAALLAKNIDVKIFDLSLLLSTTSHENCLTENYIKKIHSYHEFDRAVKETAPHAIFVDCINGINGLQWKGRQVFRIFKKHKVTYFLIEIGSLPLVTTNQKTNVLVKIKKALDLRKLMKFVSWKLGNWLVNFQYNHFARYQLPAKIFVGNTELVGNYLKRYGLHPNQIVPIHSFDYDRYLYYQRSGQQNLSASPTCVFLDQALTHHRDFNGKGKVRPVTEQHYIKSMNQFFDKIEKDTQLKIVIAASPRANPEELTRLFGNRTVITGKTLELVAQSSLVLMHYSTAVSFPILFDKPILMLKTAEMLNSFGINAIIDNMANSLGLKPICIDHQKEIDRLSLTDYSDWKGNYTAYKNKYVKTKGLADLTTWEIVVDNLQGKDHAARL